MSRALPDRTLAPRRLLATSAKRLVASDTRLCRQTQPPLAEKPWEKRSATANTIPDGMNIKGPLVVVFVIVKLTC